MFRILNIYIIKYYQNEYFAEGEEEIMSVRQVTSTRQDLEE